MSFKECLLATHYRNHLKNSIQEDIYHTNCTQNNYPHPRPKLRITGMNPGLGGFLSNHSRYSWGHCKEMFYFVRAPYCWHLTPLLQEKNSYTICYVHFWWMSWASHEWPKLNEVFWQDTSPSSWNQYPSAE